MAQAVTTATKPVWIDLASRDPAGAREFYGKLLGWDIEVNPDPQYGGYALAKLNGNDVAGIGPTMSPDAPPAWVLYMGTGDVEELSRKVKAAGGSVIVEPMDVGDQGRMAVYTDPVGAYVAAWQPGKMAGTTFQTGAMNQLSWAELNAAGIDRALPFYRELLGWRTEETPMGDGQPPYIQFLAGDERVAGGMDMTQAMSSGQLPANMPNHWLIFFGVDDVDRASRRAIELGGKQQMGPADFPGGRFSVLADPSGAVFGFISRTSAS